jgi:L-fucose mutarotase
MLLNIDPLLTADILYALRSMGHGDKLVICDANFPADAIARQSTFGELLRIGTTSSAEAARAILSVFPLDTFVDNPATRMEVVGEPSTVMPVQAEVQAEIDRSIHPVQLDSVERFAFYERAKEAYCIIATGERRFYGCFILQKGVIPPP